LSGADNEERCFALEYERSAKAKRDYLAIARVLDGQKRISHLLYLVPNYDVLTSSQEFSGPRR
jgi:hypothetical protein